MVILIICIKSIYCRILSSSSHSTGDCCRSYVTIVATPPLHPCRRCIQNSSSNEEIVDGLDSSDDDNFRHQRLSSLCLKHNYEIHFSYNLLSPYPPFLPSLNMVIDNCVIFNSGDGVRCLIFNVYQKLKLFDPSSYNHRNTNYSISSNESNTIISSNSQRNVNNPITETNMGVDGDNKHCGNIDTSNNDSYSINYDRVKDSNSIIDNVRLHKLTVLEIPNAIRCIRQVYYAMPNDSNSEISSTYSVIGNLT